MSVRKRWLALACTSLVLGGCPGPAGCSGPNSTTVETTNTPRPRKVYVSIPPIIRTPQPRPSGPEDVKPSGSVGASSLPTLKPVLPGPDFSEVPLPPGQFAFKLGQEAPGHWGLGPYLQRPRAAFVAGAVGTALIVAEGEYRASLEVFDPEASSAWLLDTRHDQEANPGNTNTRRNHGGMMWATGGVYDKELWLGGGFDGQLEANAKVGSLGLSVYRPKEGFSRTRTPREGSRTLHTGGRAAAGGVIDKSFYVAGGLNNSSRVLLPDGKTVQPVAFNITQKADLAGFNDTELVAPMPLGVASAASVVFRGHLYVIGGYNYDATGKAHTQRDVQDYDPVADKWAKSGEAEAIVPALPLALHSAAAAATAHTLYVAGGMGDDGKPVSTFYSFNFDDPTRPRVWREVPSMPTPRAMLALVPFQDALWAIGGVGADGQPTRTVEKFFTEIASPSEIATP